jgi:hypothetical protein
VVRAFYFVSAHHRLLACIALFLQKNVKIDYNTLMVIIKRRKQILLITPQKDLFLLDGPAAESLLFPLLNPRKKKKHSSSKDDGMMPVSPDSFPRVVGLAEEVE